MEARRGEERYIAKALADLGVPIIRTICGDATFTTYVLFRDGQFLTQSIQSDKKFLALADL
ncbi:MAG: YoaP domain-containing protein [Hornefia butyriciproducens]|nr:YoaP domain-containing protein [Hornefia butyriciproducens]MDY5423053.1 YoaP domain-containing protein [Hornefia butyriciproducens]